MNCLQKSSRAAESFQSVMWLLLHGTRLDLRYGYTVTPCCKLKDLPKKAEGSSSSSTFGRKARVQVGE